MLYGEKDIQDIRAKLRSFWLVQALLLCGLSAAVTLIFLFVQKNQLLTMIISVIWVLVALFYLLMWGRPLMKYQKHLQRIKAGITSTITGTLKEIEETAFLWEGIEVYGVILQDGEFEKRLYFDASKPLPDIKVGTPIEVELYEHFILDINRRNA